MNARILLAALLLAAFAACNSPSDPGEEQAESRLAASYTGPVSGSYVAEGTPNLTSAPNTQTFASGSRRAADGLLEVVSYRQRGGGRFDLATVSVPAAAVGNVAVDRNCGQDECPSVTIALDLGQATGSVASHTCHLDTGTIRVAALAAGRASGTFSGSGFCLPGEGGLLEGFQVTSGSFDIELRQQ
ncbi:MAG TPA: hypothetical protein VHG08_29165 [Longimicrobium sp.]|nr:hypothetical protein [Longimicrobium sp.]